MILFFMDKNNIKTAAVFMLVAVVISTSIISAVWTYTEMKRHDAGLITLKKSFNVLEKELGIKEDKNISEAVKNQMALAKDKVVAIYKNKLNLIIISWVLAVNFGAIISIFFIFRLKKNSHKNSDTANN